MDIKQHEAQYEAAGYRVWRFNYEVGDVDFRDWDEFCDWVAEYAEVNDWTVVASMLVEAVRFYMSAGVESDELELRYWTRVAADGTGWAVPFVVFPLRSVDAHVSVNPLADVGEVYVWLNSVDRVLRVPEFYLFLPVEHVPYWRQGMSVQFDPPEFDTSIRCELRNEYGYGLVLVPDGDELLRVVLPFLLRRVYSLWLDWVDIHEEVVR